MKCQSLLPLILSALVAAQEGSLPSLTEALAAQSENLSALSSLLETQPNIVQALAGQTNITILAPNNDAINQLLSDSTITARVAADPSIVAAILSYHVLSGTYYAANFTETPQFFETLLSNDTYEQVEGGQVVGAVAADNSVTFYSALKAESTVTVAASDFHTSHVDVEFAGGVIHIIDAVLTIPLSIVDTATAANLTSLAGAATQAGLVQTLLDAESITVFAPNNEAFAPLGSLDDVSEEDLQNILQYHVVAGTVAYSSSLEEGSVETLSGESVSISIRDGDVYVNDAKVVLADVLISNGVVHVIDSVLNPESSSPSSSATIPAPSSEPSSEPSEVPQAGAPRATAAIAIGAVLAGAAMVMNF